MPDTIKLPGILSRQIETERLNVHILTSGPPAGTAVLFIHGYCSSAGIWDETMRALPDGFHGIALDLRGFGITEPLPIDATLGLDDMVADVRSLVEALGLSPFHLVGHGMGGGIAMKYAIRYSSQLLSITLVDTMSPYGYGGSKDDSGTPVYADGAPAGAASVNPDFVRLLAAKETGAEEPLAPINVIRQFFLRPPFAPQREARLLDAMLSTHVGDEWYPGDSVPSPNWPGTAPGKKGVMNACSRKYFDASAFAAIKPQPSLLWIRGADDLLISDRSWWDPACLGAMSFVPGWPGEEEVPPQPMLAQTRRVLMSYRAAGGRYEEIVLEDTGYTPFIERAQEFDAIFHAHLEANT